MLTSVDFSRPESLAFRRGLFKSGLTRLRIEPMRLRERRTRAVELDLTTRSPREELDVYAQRDAISG